MNDAVKRLNRLDCCAVSDAMDKLGLRDRVASGLEQRSTARRITGRAMTYRLVAAEEASQQGGQLRGVAGVVAEGPVRDIDEARAYDFPVYCRGLTARTARGRVAEAETNRPVTIGDVTVSAGDYVIADASGVAFVPAADIERVLDAAELIAGREAEMAKALLAGTPIPDVMGADYEHMLR